MFSRKTCLCGPVSKENLSMFKQNRDDKRTILYKHRKLPAYGRAISQKWALPCKPVAGGNRKGCLLKRSLPNPAQNTGDLLGKAILSMHRTGGYG